MPVPLTDRQLARLLQFRIALRRFQRWSDEQVADQGLTPAQHQLLLAVRAHPDPDGPSITELAGYLLIRHHSAIGLLKRAEALGLVSRHDDASDQRLVRIRLTERGRDRVDALAAVHLEELRTLAPALDALVDTGGDPRIDSPAPTDAS